MKKIALAALVAATALSATPAFANVTGTINVSGNVTGRCAVIQGTTESNTFGGDIQLGRLDAADGTLRSELTTSSTATPAELKRISARVVCTSANPVISVSATKLNNGEQAAAQTGYANTIDYVAAVRVNTTSSSTPISEFTFDTAQHTTAQGGALTSRIAGGTANNVEVNVSNLRTQGGAANVLNQGNYSSVVSVAIRPTL